MTPPAFLKVSQKPCFSKSSADKHHKNFFMFLLSLGCYILWMCSYALKGYVKFIYK